MDIDLRHLSRRDLLEMLVKISEEKDALEKELEETKKQLAERTVILEHAGSIADATVELNGLFETAQRTADEYLLSIAKLKTQYEEKLKDLEQTK